MVRVGGRGGVMAVVWDMLLRRMAWGGSGRSSNRSSDKKGSGAGLLIILLIVVAIFAPLAAKAVQMAVSRQREYLADATSVQFTRNPNGLIAALGNLTDKPAPFPDATPPTRHLFISNPVPPSTPQ